MTTNETTNWRDLAACKGLDLAIFFPTKRVSAVRARAVCDACPVAAECLQASFDGSDGDVEHGVWAGSGYRGRRRQRMTVRGRKRRGNLPKPINHGTAGGYQAHLRQGIEICTPCRDAMTAQRVALKARKDAV